MRALLCILALACVAAMRVPPECDGSFMRLVDHLASKGNRLTAADLSALADSPRALNPADFLEGRESAAHAWRRAFDHAIRAPGFDWDVVRAALTARASAGQETAAKRATANARTRDVPVAVLESVLPSEFATTELYLPGRTVGTTVFVTGRPSGIVAIDTTTFTAKKIDMGSATFFSFFARGKKTYAFDMGDVVDLTTKRRKRAWPTRVPEVVHLGRLGNRDLLYGRHQKAILVRSLDRGKAIEIARHLNEEPAEPNAAKIAGEDKIVFHAENAVHMLAPLTNETTKFDVRFGPLVGPPSFFDGGRRAVFKSQTGFHFVDLVARKELGTVPVNNMGGGAVPMPIAGTLGATRIENGVALLDLAGRQLIARVPSRRVTTEVVSIVHDGKPYFVWGDESGSIYILGSDGTLLSKNKVRNGFITTLAPFTRDGKVMAIVSGQDLPALVQLVGPQSGSAD